MVEDFLTFTFVNDKYQVVISIWYLVSLLKAVAYVHIWNLENTDFRRETNLNLAHIMEVDCTDVEDLTRWDLVYWFLYLLTNTNTKEKSFDEDVISS